MAVTAFRGKTKRLDGPYLEGPIAAAALLYRLAIVMRDASGNLKNGATAAGCFGVGVARYNDVAGNDANVWDNSAGSAGDLRAKYDGGIWGPFDNSGSSITAGMEGDVCYIVDNETVHATSNSGARSPAGLIFRVTSDGVYVEFDEMKVRMALAIGAAAGIAFVQTAYDTANATIDALTSVALTDNGGGTADNTVASMAAPVTLTDSTGQSGTHDDTLAATTVPATLTDSTGQSGTHDDTLAATTVPAALTENSGAIGGSSDGDLPALVDPAGDAGASVIAGIRELATRVNTIQTLLGVMTQNQSDVAQKVMEHNTLVGVMVQNASDTAQKIIEIVTLLGTHQNNAKEYTTQLAALRADLVDVKQGLNSAIDVLQASGLAG